MTSDIGKMQTSSTKILPKGVLKLRMPIHLVFHVECTLMCVLSPVYTIQLVKPGSNRCDNWLYGVHSRLSTRLYNPV